MATKVKIKEDKSLEYTPEQVSYKKAKNVILYSGLAFGIAALFFIIGGLVYGWNFSVEGFLAYFIIAIIAVLAGVFLLVKGIIDTKKALKELEAKQQSRKPGLKK